MSKVLFLFTKNYPYGTQEQYIADEQNHLSAKFDKVIFVPCELFSEKQMEVKREIPSNAEILLINQETLKARKPKAHFSEFLSVFFGEWMRAENKSWFWKERKRYASVLRHQSACASYFADLLEYKYRNQEKCFYAYWIHNSAIMLGLMKKRGAIKDYIVRGHSIDLYDWDWTPTKTVGLKVLPFYNFNIASAGAIYPISNHGEKFLKNKFPRYSEKIKSFHLGVPDCGTNQFDASAVFTIVTCGATSFAKGIHRVPAVLSLLKFPVLWIHFGNEGNVTDRVKKEVASLPANVRVELRGFTPNAEIKKLYATETVHLFLNLSEVEGVPVSIMEAISFGIPVIGTDVYGTSEVANENTGWSVPYEVSTGELAGLISTFAGDHSLQEKLRKSSKQYFLQNFLASTNYEAFTQELFRHLNS